MSASKPTARDRLQRGSPITQPSAATQPASGPVRVKPYRLTVDLAPADYEHLRNWAHHAHMSHSDVLRALVKLLDDPSVGQQVRNSATP
jgi:hypothetical protein